MALEKSPPTTTRVIKMLRSRRPPPLRGTKSASYQWRTSCSETKPSLVPHKLRRNGSKLICRTFCFPMTKSASNRWRSNMAANGMHRALVCYRCQRCGPLIQSRNPTIR
ncbi:hypothetical protein CEXT_12621 [Caerostris extrusa]|uniref:Uncharacterized protein n=1 Tax=Caerostris extrusa TaxID=172846 RepID=A0AAV4PCI0_CAEEX|nr:hypothetical protein CEXT_12621 [Caerostris extrusa]